jgi:hypothetical protein
MMSAAASESPDVVQIGPCTMSAMPGTAPKEFEPTLNVAVMFSTLEDCVAAAHGLADVTKAEGAGR